MKNKNEGCPDPKTILHVSESCKALLEPLRDLLRHVEKLAHPARSACDFARVEADVAASVASVECAAIGVVLQGLDATSDRVQWDGKVWASLGLHHNSYRLSAGLVPIARKLFRQVGVHNGPTLDVVAMRAGVVGDGWLPGAAKSMAYLLQQAPARQAEKTARQLGRLPYSRSSFERVGHLVGELYVERHLDIEGELIEMLEIPERAHSVSVAMDRVSLPMEEIVISKDAQEKVTRVWHMAYVGALTLHDTEGKALKTIRYARMPEHGIDQMAESLQGDLLHILALRPKLAVVKLADGAKEMRRRLDEIVEGVVERPVDLLDFWHAVENLGKAAHAMYPELPANQMLALWRFWLINHDDGAERVLKILDEFAGLEVVDSAITYVNNNISRMRYAQARADGLPIGSGNVESSCKTIVRQRMSRGGSRWKHTPGERILHLRSLAQSDRWDKGIALALRPLRQVVQEAA